MNPSIVRHAVNLVALGLATLAAIPCAAPPARAHQTPRPLALWGGFAAPEARCQRILSWAAEGCATTAWKLSGGCSAAQADGASCDTTATRAAINQAHAAALDVADGACASVDLSSMGFSTPMDVNIDVDIFCQELEDAMVSAVYRPATQRGVIGAVKNPTAACIAATASAATRLLRLALRDRSRLFDWIASFAFGPQEKLALVTASSARIQHLQTATSLQLTALCPNFTSLYGRTPNAFLKLVAQRADCFSARTYVQDAVQCPQSVCGNGMREAGEQCDDGNLIDGDGCDHTCGTETAPTGP